MVKVSAADIKRRHTPNADLIIESIKAEELGLTYGQLQARRYMEEQRKSHMANQTLREVRKSPTRDDKIECLHRFYSLVDDYAVSFKQSLKILPTNPCMKPRLLTYKDFGFVPSSSNVYYDYNGPKGKVFIMRRDGVIYIIEATPAIEKVLSDIEAVYMENKAPSIILEDWYPAAHGSALKWERIFG